MTRTRRLLAMLLPAMLLLANTVTSAQDAPAFTVVRVFRGFGWVGPETQLPADVLVDEDEGCFYVTHWRNSYVKKYRLDGTFVDWFGESRSYGNTFGAPYGIAAGADGNLYLTLDSPGTVFVMTRNGKKVRTFAAKGPGDGQLSRPKGLARSPVNGFFYVVDRYNFRVQAFDADGKVKHAWGSMGSKPGQFYLARGIAIDKRGSVYVADTFNHRVQVFDADGKFLRAFGKRGDGYGGLKYPSGIAISPKGEVFVTDAGNGRIAWFTKAGKPLGTFGRRGTKPGEFNQPLGLAVDSKGRVWVADTMNHRVQVLVPTAPPGAPPEFLETLVRTPKPGRGTPLTLDAVPKKVSGFPVQLGVPFLPGELDEPKIVVLKNGRAVASSATTLARWGGNRRGVKVALVRFQADLDTMPTRDYSIAFGANAPKSEWQVPPLHVDKGAGIVLVNTGRLRFTVVEKPTVLFRDVRLDGKKLIDASALEVVRTDGKRFSKLKDGKVVVEHKDSMIAVVKATASFDDPDAGGLGILARITAYAGKPYVKLDVTLIQNADAPVLELAGWKLRLVPATPFAAYEIGGEKETYAGKLDRPVTLLQDGELTPKDGSLRVVATRLKYTGVGTGKRAPGWAKTSSPDGAVLAAVRHFWQQYPKSIAIAPDALDLWLQSPRSKTTFKPLVAGWAKTHEILLHFDAASADADASRAAFQKGVRASAPAERYQQCGIFGSYALPGPASRDYDFVATTFLDYTRGPHVVHFAFQGSGRWWMEGNLNFGNRMVWNYYMNNTRDSAGRLFMHSLRLLDAYPAHSRYAFDLAEAQARCSMDLHVMHADHREGKYAGWGPGMIYGHASNRGAPAIFRRRADLRRYAHFAEPLNLASMGTRWGPMIHPAGLMEYYLLTGEPRAREVLVEIADWVVALQKRGGRDYTQVIRAVDGPTGLFLWTLMSAYEATGDARYLDALYATLPILREVAARSKGTLVGRWKDPTRCGILTTCLIRLLDFDERFGRLDRAEVTGWIVKTTEVFHRLVRRRADGSARLTTRCAGSNRMMEHAFGWVAALPDAPDWAKDDFRDLMLLPAWHTTQPDEERFDFIRPGCHDGRITVCSTIEEGTEMFLWNSAETLALHQKVFGKSALPKPDDPMNAYYAEYQRTCREDPDSIIPLPAEAPDEAERGDFKRIPTYTVVRAKTPPVIDGDPSDDCWKRANAITGLTLRDRVGPSKLDTTFKVAYDAEHLYVLLIAPDLKPPSRQHRRDGRQWAEDGMELFLDTNFDRTSYFKIALNLSGPSCDDYWAQPFLADRNWNPKLHVGRKPGVIEVAIPFKEFPGPWNANRPVRPEGKWSANFYRTGDSSSWVGYNMLLTSHIPQGFGVLVFEKPDK